MNTKISQWLNNNTKNMFICPVCCGPLHDRGHEIDHETSIAFQIRYDGAQYENYLITTVRIGSEYFKFVEGDDNDSFLIYYGDDSHFIRLNSIQNIDIDFFIHKAKLLSML